MWREHRRCPIQQKTSQPIAQLGGAIVASSSGLFVVGVAGAVTIGAMVEFADQLHRPFQCMNAAVAMVADVHHPSTGRTSTVEDVEFPQSEIGIRGPLVGHPADLHVLVRSIGCESATRGYAKKPSASSSLSGH